MIEANELPKGWVRTTLGDVTAPARISIQPNKSTTLPYIGMEHIESETMRLIGTSPASELKSNAVRFFPGDVLYGRLRPYLNKVFRPDFEGLCSSEFIVFRESSNLNSRYLQYFLNSWSFKEFASHLVEGDRPRVDWGQLNVFDFLLPPLAEQSRIVAAIEQQFTRLDAAVASLQQAKEKLKRYRASVLKAAVEGKLTEEWRADHPATEATSELLERILKERRARWEADLRAKGKDPSKVKYVEPAKPDVEGLPELPEGWCWASLDQSSRRITDGTHQPPQFTEEGIPFIFVTHIVKGSISFENTKFISESTYNLLNARCPVEYGDILYSAVGSYGVAVPVLIRQPFSFQRHIAHIKPSTSLSMKYLIFSLNSPVCLDQSHHVARGVAQKTVTLTDLARFAIPLAPRDEQEQIVSEVERRLSVINRLETTIEANLKRAERERQSILREAFAGRLVQQDPNDEPAGVLLERIREERAKREQEEKLARKNKEVAMTVPHGKNTRRTLSKQKLPLHQVLVEAQKPIAADELLRTTEGGVQADTLDELHEAVHDFYVELHEEVEIKGRIKKIPQANKPDLLEAVSE